MELFLSHATADAELVSLVCTRLEALDVRVYVAEHDNQAGANLHAKVEEAIRRSNLIIVLLTRSGFDSHYVHQEIGFARQAGKLIVPLVTSHVPQSGLGMLEGTEYISLDERDPNAGLERLAGRVSGLVRQQQRQDELMMIGFTLMALGIVIWSLSE